MNPTPHQILEFFKDWIPRYNFGICLEGDAYWVDPDTNKRLRKNQIVCLMKNDLCAEFPSMSNALARKTAEKTVMTMEKRMTDRIRAGEGSYIDVSDSYL